VDTWLKWRHFGRARGLQQTPGRKAILQVK
jgi:hypothetical protein